MQHCLHRTHARSLPSPPSRRRSAMAAATNHAAPASAAPQTHEPGANAHATSAPAAPAPVAAFKDVQFVSYDKNGFTVRGRMQLPGVPHSTVMEVLTDYPACASVFHNITSCSAEPLPSGHKRVSQSCRWGFLGFSGKFDASFEVQEQRDTPSLSQLQFNLIESSFMRHFYGHWRVQHAPPAGPAPSLPQAGVQPVAAGVQPEPAGVEGCIVEHTMQVQPRMHVPRPIVRITKGIFVSQVSRIFDDLEAEVMRRHASSKASSESGASIPCRV